MNWTLSPEDLAFRGEKQDFQEIAGNLMENACIWSQRRVRVTATLEDEASGMTRPPNWTGIWPAR